MRRRFRWGCRGERDQLCSVLSHVHTIHHHPVKAAEPPANDLGQWCADLPGLAG